MKTTDFLDELVLPERYDKMTKEDLKYRIVEIKNQLGKDLFIVGHHYQKDEVVDVCDVVGDSLQLAQISASQKEAKYIVFCGVHFMAETAEILTDAHQQVFMPDMMAGCPMADMANEAQAQVAWDKLEEIFGDTVIPLTYVNSTAEVKSFVGKKGGATVTSSNAREMLKWAFSQKERILFLPDQHLGRNTAAEMGISLEQMASWNPMTETFTYEGDLSACKIILWEGHCGVHQKFTPENVTRIRQKYPNMKVIVHPECLHEVVSMSDLNGSTQAIIQTIKSSEADSEWAIGTEINLVNRLAKMYPEKKIISLNPFTCSCVTMNRIHLSNLLWVLERIVDEKPVNFMTVQKDVALYAKKAIKRMLSQVG